MKGNPLIVVRLDAVTGPATVVEVLPGDAPVDGILDKYRDPNGRLPVLMRIWVGNPSHKPGDTVCLP